MMPTTALTPPPTRYAPQLLATPGVGGVFVVVAQAHYEPTQGTFDQTTLDAQLAGIPKGMPIILALQFGANAAPWMATLPGGATWTGVVEDGYHSGNPVEVTVGAPFTEAYVTAALRTKTQLAGDLTGYNVVAVMLGHDGWYDTESPNYPIGVGGPSDPSWKTGSAAWAAIGYRPMLARQAALKYANGVADLFPNADYIKAPWDASTGRGLPMVAPDGTVLDAPNKLEILLFMKDLAQTFGDRAWAVFNSLDETGKIPNFYTPTQSYGLKFGCQTVTGTHAKPWPQQVGQITAAAKAAAAAGAGTLQFHPAAVRAFPAEIAEAAAIIAGGAEVAP